MSQHLRSTLSAALCAVVAATLTACSSGGTTVTPGGPAGSAPAVGQSSAATPSAAAPGAAAGVATGTRLNLLLLPAGAVPPKLTLDAGGSRNTGNDLADASTGPAPTVKNCIALNGLSWIGATGIGSASFAQNDYTDSTGRMFAQELDAYHGTDAHTVMTRAAALFASCAHFQVKQDGTVYTAKLTHRKLTGVGDEAVEAVVTSSSWDGGSTLIAARVGDVVVTTLYNDQKTTGGADLALTKDLVKKVRAAH
jgi:hypothetical protein